MALGVEEDGESVWMLMLSWWCFGPWMYVCSSGMHVKRAFYITRAEVKRIYYASVLAICKVKQTDLPLLGCLGTWAIRKGVLAFRRAIGQQRPICQRPSTAPARPTCMRNLSQAPLY